MNALPDEYGVIGYPVAHSRSPFIHTQFARQTGQNLVYRLHEVPPERLRAAVLEFARSGGRGLNVTVPHKVAAAALAHELSARAGRAGAVNTLSFEDHRILADNTDGAGLVRDLADNLHIGIRGRRILLVGAGGAARGVIAPLMELQPAQLVIAARSAERAAGLAAQFTDLGAVQGLGLGQLPGHAFDLVINATSAGLSGEVPALPATVIDGATACYDMSYGKGDTPFVTWARAHGCGRAVQGWGMLVEQAAESFALWRGIRPQTAPVLALLAGEAR